MASFIVIELDTTSPVIEIFNPRYTTRDISNTITISSSEDLDGSNIIYIEDADGNRIDYTFSKVGERELRGKVRLSNYPIGLAKICAMVTDEVGNQSNLVISTIEVRESHPFISASIKDSALSMDIKDGSSKIECHDVENNISAIDKTLHIQIDSSERKSSIKDYVANNKERQ
jgi:hypothetical protein